jgi:hypothetical protein
MKRATHYAGLALGTAIIGSCGIIYGDGGGSVGAGADAGSNRGCIVATVKRARADSQQPWVKWPLAADGNGTLIASAVQNGSVKARNVVTSANVTKAEASYVLDLGCPGPGVYVLRAFLDDNGDAGAQDVTSNDFRDSCMGGTVPETVEITVQASQTANAELVLYQSCNPMVD